MAADADVIEAESEQGAPSKGGSKVRLLSLGDLDGRTSAARLVRDLIGSIESDLGGRDHLATAERQIVKRAALTGAMLEDLAVRWLSGEPVDPGLYATLANSERRLLETVGLRRRARDAGTLTEYINKRGAS